MKNYLILLPLVGLLAACGSVSTPESRAASQVTLDARGGTLNYSAGIGTSFIFDFGLANETSNEVEVSIVGPKGWNDGKPVQRSYNYKTPGHKITWTQVFQNNGGQHLEVMPGAYEVTAKISGVEKKKTVQIESAVLDKPQNLRLTELSEGAVAAEWSSVSEAGSYLVEVFSSESGLERGVIHTYTELNTITFEDYMLTPGATHYLAVTALTANYSSVPSNLAPISVFNTSYSHIKFIAP